MIINTMSNIECFSKTLYQSFKREEKSQINHVFFHFPIHRGPGNFETWQIPIPNYTFKSYSRFPGDKT